MEKDKTQFMTGYETRLYKGWQKTAADKLKDEKMLESELKRCLGIQIPVELETGEVINVDAKTILVLKRMGYDMEHPEKIDLKVYASVLNESKQEVQVETQTASDVFKGIAIKQDDTNTQ